MDDNTPKFWGASKADWGAAYSRNVSNIYATRYVMKGEGSTLRIAFGMEGPPLDEKGSRGDPEYMVAMHLAPDMAMKLALSILEILKPTFETDNNSGGENGG